MGRLINRIAKTTLSIAVPLESRELLETKAKQSGQTMSDLVDKLIRKAFGVKHGLARRVADRKAQINSELESMEVQLLIEAEQARQKNSDLVKQELAKLESALKQEIDRIGLATIRANKEAAFKLLEVSKEWEDSMQAMLLKTCPPDAKPENWDVDFMSRWLFDRRVIGTKAKNGQTYSFDRLPWGPNSFMVSPMIPDKLMAADLAAEAEVFELSTQAYEHMLSCYSNSPDAMYAAFDSPCNSPQVAEFWAFLKESDRLFGSDLAESIRGCGSTKWVEAA